MNLPWAEVIGDPIAQSKSPAIHGFWLGELALPGRYERCLVTADGLADYLAARRADPDWRGCNVTMPHKQAIIPLLDRLDPLAARIGAVNTVVREADGSLTGYNTDATGFLEPLAGRAFRAATVIGAGGAARAVLAALADAGIGHVAMQNRSVSKGAALLEEFGLRGHCVPLGAGVPLADLLVNTSALGMAGHPPLPGGLLDAVAVEGTVYDIVTTPLDTALLQDARARGLATVDGLAMLIGQAAAAFSRFFGVEPPGGHDAELRALILS